VDERVRRALLALGTAHDEAWAERVVSILTLAVGLPPAPPIGYDPTRRAEELD
jgi:hypothetical protein